MIEFFHLTKVFKNNFWGKELLALNDVSFKIEKGDLVGFLGANGAGKTTLIKILLDFSRATSGEIKFSNEMGVNHAQIKSSMGYLPERPYLYPHLTGNEFLQYVGTLNSIESDKLAKSILYWSEKLEIAHALNRFTKEYSKGMLQRLGFVSCLIHDPKMLILDEPLSGLDPLGRRDFKNIMQELNRDGVTIFFSSHIVSDVEEICNKVIFIEKGKLVYEGNIDTLLLDHAREEFIIKTLVGDTIHSEIVKSEEKDDRIKKLIEKNVNIIGLEKEKISLEEIIYKIKK